MKLLLVEDDYLTRDMYEHSLKTNGHTVLTAQTGVIGLNLAKKEELDGILLDIMLPEMDGVSFLRQLREFETENKKGPVPVIITSNLGQETVVKECMQWGIKGYLIKARFTPQTLVDEITRLLTDTE